MTFSKEKKDLIWAGVSFLFFTLIFTCSVLPFYYGLILGAFVALFMLIKSEKPKSEKKDKIRNIMLLVVTPPLMFFITELLNVNGISVFQHVPAILLNLLFYYAIEYLCLSITKKSNLAIVITVIFFGLLAIINGYVVEYRGYGFAITDIHSVETAINIAHEYTYELNELQLFSLIIMFFLIKFSSLGFIKLEYPNWNVHQVLSVGVLLFYIFSITTFPVLQLIKIEPKFYYDHPNGAYLNLLGTIQILSKDKTPDEYSQEAVQEYVDTVMNNYNQNYTIENKEKPVNIICIMNEALGDYSVYKNFNMKEDPISYIHSMKENAITGYTYSSVYGGNTVISEYEFITNNSAQFFGSTMSPFSTFVNENSYSLAKQLNEDYYSIFIHPYKKISYNRPYAYECLGFDEQYYDVDLLNKRDDYYSDSGLYKIIENMTEEHEDPLFIFTVTVQNHSPYTLMDELNIPVENTGYGELADKYFSVLRQSDIAFKELIDYYSKSDEKTIIVMFGDHQAKLDSEFFETVDGNTLSHLLVDNNQNLYKTPFVIWANYPIEEQSDVELSINYLSNLMLEQTNLSKTPYQYFLTELRQTLPIVNNNGFIDNKGNVYGNIKELPEELRELAKIYSYFEYNLIFDKDYVFEQLNTAK